MRTLRLNDDFDNKYEPFHIVIGNNKTTIASYDVKKYKEMDPMIDAVKQLRVDYNIGLKEAKEIIDKIRENKFFSTIYL